MTSNSAQLLFGSETAPSDVVIGDSEVDPSVEASFLNSVKDLLEDKRADLLAEVRPSMPAAAVKNPPPGEEEDGPIVMPGSKRVLEFETEDMYVDDLREECSLRGLPTSGAKAVVIKRLQDACAARPELSRKRLTWHTRKRKRQMNKREPERSEYATEEEFTDAWEKWRQTRDQNNESVKRSRENSRAKKLEHDRLCQERERENAELSKQVQNLRDQVSFLTKVLQSDTTGGLSEEEESRISCLMGPLLAMDRQREEGSEAKAEGR